jgi:hypothetical protein
VSWLETLADNEKDASGDRDTAEAHHSCDSEARHDGGLLLVDDENLTEAVSGLPPWAERSGQLRG